MAINQSMLTLSTTMKIIINLPTYMKHLAQVSSVHAFFGVNKKRFSRLALWVLIFVFAMSSAWPGMAFAQEASNLDSPEVEASPTAPPTGSTPVLDTPAIDTPAVSTPAADATGQGDPQTGNATPPMALGQGNPPADPGKPGESDGGQVETLSAGTGEEYTYDRDPVKASLKINTDASTGAFTYSYPLSIPPGRSGMQPSLSLNYHSQDLRNDSLAGYGWSLSISYIERIARKGVDKLYDGNDEYFTSSLSGELEKISTGNYGPKVENGDFLKYQFSGNIWTVTDKKGTVYTFGSASASLQDDATGTKIFKWMIQKIQDTNGNYVRYEYFKDAGQVYPSKIFYTGNGISDGIFEIEFLRQARTDKAAMYGTGFSVTTNFRINEIQAKVSGVWKRKYVLGYGTGDNGVRSLLASLTESGQDELGVVTTLPAITFSYSQSARSWTLDGSLVLPTYFIDVNRVNTGAWLEEVNGDAFIDIVLSSARGSTDKKVFLNTSTGWSLAPGFDIPEYFLDGVGADLGVRLVDVDGDGFSDLVRGDSLYEINKVYLNNRNNTGWTRNTNYSLPEYFVPGDTGARIGDVNDAGLVDILRAYIQINAIDINRTHLNDGDDTGWTQQATNYTPLPGYFSNSQDLGTRLMDVNGDGLVDFVHGSSDGVNQIRKVHINQGTGWVQDTAYSFPESIGPGDRLVDINGDGLVDVIRGHIYSPGPCQDGGCNKVYINKGDGTGWAEFPGYLPLPEVFEEGGDTGTRLADVNGDGLVDFLRGYDHLGANIRRVKLHDGVVPDLLTNITSHTSATTAVTYQSSALYKNGSTLLNPSLPFTVQTAKQIVTNDGRGTLSTTTYSYEGGSYYYNTPYDRKFAGFGKITETDNGGNVTKTFYHQGNTTDTANGEFSDHISKRGKPYRVEQYNNTGNLFSKAINKWEHVSLGGNRYFVKKTQEISFSYDGDADRRDTAATYTYNDTNGNLTEKKEWGEVLGSDDGTITDTGTDIFRTSIVYASNPTAYIIGLPQQEFLADQNFIQLSATRHYYDLQALGSVTKGNETKTEHWVTGSTYIDTEKTYNTTYGIVTQEKDPRDKATNYTYDSFNLYPATVAQPLSLTASYLYDYSSGKVTQVTDPNTRVFQTVYDGLDRVKEEKQPDKATPTTLVTTATYSYNDSANPRSVTKTDYLTDTLQLTTYNYLDGLDRTIQARTRAEDANTYSVKDVVYDALGHVQKESLPYFSTGSAFTTATTNNALYTTYAYDALDRVLNATNAVGTTSHVYDQWKETVTDAKGKIKDYTSDAYGNLIKVEEHNGAAVYATNYTYNGLNKLINITDALGNVRNFTYDGIGRRLIAQDLHASADATFGTWTYTYDASGNLITQLDPKSQTVNFTYDDLNRVLTEDFTAQTGTEKSYVYDTCTEGKGKLCTANVGGSGGPTNLLTNGGFESGGLTPWVFQNYPNRATSTVTSNPGEFAEGTKGVRVDITTPGQDWEIQVRQENLSFSPQLYTLKFWAKAASSRTIRVSAQEAGTWINLGLWQTPTLTTSWQQFIYTFTPGITTSLGQLSFNVGATNPSVWLDGVELTTGSGGGGSPTVSTAFTYYATGEVKQETKTIDTSNYATVYTYDRQGNATNIKYPDLSEVQYAYNPGALTETVQKKESGGAFTNVITDFDYNPLGQVTYQANANGTETTNTYDQNELIALSTR